MLSVKRIVFIIKRNKTNHFFVKTIQMIFIIKRVKRFGTKVKAKAIDCIQKKEP